MASRRLQRRPRKARMASSSSSSSSSQSSSFFCCCIPSSCKKKQSLLQWLMVTLWLVSIPTSYFLSQNLSTSIPEEENLLRSSMSEAPSTTQKKKNEMVFDSQTLKAGSTVTNHSTTTTTTTSGITSSSPSNNKNSTHADAILRNHQQPTTAATIITTKSTTITNKSSSSSTSTSTSDKPYFILHIGPPKTATTTIQCALQRHARTLARSDDATYYLGAPCVAGSKVKLPNGEESIMGGLVVDLRDGKVNGTHVEDLRMRLQKHYHYLPSLSETILKHPRQQQQHHHRHQHHLMLSMEGFSRRLTRGSSLQILADMLTDWQVRIILSYRHYFDWLPSLHFQQQYEAQGTIRVHNRRIRQKRATGEYRTLQLRTFSDFVAGHLNATKEGGDKGNNNHNNNKKGRRQGPVANAMGEHLTLRAYKLYSQYFTDAPPTVFSFHHDDDDDDDDNTEHHTAESTQDGDSDLATRFICQTIPTAKRLCQQLQQQQAQQQQRQNHQRKPVKRRTAEHTSHLDGLRLLVLSLEHNLIPPELVEEESPVYQLLLDRLNGFVHDNIPANRRDSPFMTCLSDDLQQKFLDVSVAFEQELLELQGIITTEANRNRTRIKHIQAFERQVQMGKFCELDPDRFRNDPIWKKKFVPMMERELRTIVKQQITMAKKNTLKKG